MAECKHEKLVECYYGNAPWDVLTDDEQARTDADEYAHSHGTCEICHGEWGDGWSTCTCDDDEDEWLYRCGWVRGMGCTLAGSEECDVGCPLRRDNERGLALTHARMAKRAAEREAAQPTREGCGR